MFLTLTVNAALDRLLFIDLFTPGTTHRADKMLDCVGGKGFDTSVALRGLGQETMALGFIAGQNGAALVKLLESYGIQHDLIWLAGETRLAHVIIERSQTRHSHVISPGYPVNAQACQELLERVRLHAPQAQWIIAAGSLPAGAPLDFYRSVSQLARQHGLPVLVDCSGEPMRQAIEGRPAIVKMNEAEFWQTFAEEYATPPPLIDLQRHARQLVQRYSLESLVITLGRRGILAVLPGRGFLAAAPEQAVVNAAGAGDAASAALAWRLALNDNWESALRWAAAAGAATTLTAATGECRFTDVQAIFPAVEVKLLSL
jgi:1-phosphofructokinase family hexose kinase